MRSIAWVAEKGGVGKTTCAVNTSVGLAKKGKRVLLVDCDPQANASMVFLGGLAADAPTIHEVLIGTADAADSIRRTATPRLDLLPATTALADANLALVNEVGRERRLRLAMRDVDDGYDFVVFDTSPSRSLININVLNYVAEVYCPVDPGIFSLAGLATLQSVIAEVVRFLDNPVLRISGLVITRAARDNLTRDVEAQIRATFAGMVCEASIPANVKIGEAHGRFLSVLDYAPRSPGAIAYMDLAREIIAHGEANRSGDGVDGNAPADGPARCSRRRGRAAG